MSSIIEYSADLDDAEAPTPPPVGTYPANIEGAEVKESKTSGNSYLGLTMRIPVEAYPADYNPENYPDGVVVTYNRVVIEDTAQGRYRMRKLREACGLRPGGRTVDPSEFLGLTVMIAAGHDDYEGVKRMTCDKIIAAA